MAGEQWQASDEEEEALRREMEGLLRVQHHIPPYREPYVQKRSDPRRGPSFGSSERSPVRKSPVHESPGPGAYSYDQGMISPSRLQRRLPEAPPLDEVLQPRGTSTLRDSRRRGGSSGAPPSALASLRSYNNLSRSAGAGSSSSFAHAHVQRKHDLLHQRMQEMQQEQEAMMSQALWDPNLLDTTIQDVERLVRDHEELDRRLRERRQVTNKINQLSAVGLKPEVAMVQSELEAAESRNRHLSERFNKLREKNRQLEEKGRLWSTAEELINKHFRAAAPSVKVRVQRADLVEKVGVLLDECAGVRGCQQNVERENEDLSRLKRDNERKMSSLKQRLRKGKEERELLAQALESNRKEMELCQEVMERLKGQVMRSMEEGRALKLEMHRERDARKALEEENMRLRLAAKAGKMGT